MLEKRERWLFGGGASSAGVYACSVDSNGVKPQMRHRDVRNDSRCHREWQLSLSVAPLKNPPKDTQQWSGSDLARRRTMPEMEKGRPPESKRSRKPAHPVKREINQEMKVRDYSFLTSEACYVYWAITPVRTHRLPTLSQLRTNQCCEWSDTYCVCLQWAFSLSHSSKHSYLLFKHLWTNFSFFFTIKLKSLESFRGQSQKHWYTRNTHTHKKF